MKRRRLRDPRSAPRSAHARFIARLLVARLLVARLLLASLLGASLAGCAATPKDPPVAFPPAPQFPPDHRYGLDDLIALSIHRNASLDVARYEAEAAQGLVDQVKALWLPSLRYNFALTGYDNDLSYKANAFDLVSIDVPITGSYNVVNSLTLSQIVVTGGKRTSGLKQARMFAEIKRLETLRLQDVVAQDVALYYHLVCLTSDMDAVLDDTLRRLKVFRQVADGLNRRGSLRASRLDVLQADFLIAQIEQVRLFVRSARQQAYAALRQAVGVAHDEPLVLKAASLPPPVSGEKVLSVYGEIVKGFLARPENRQVDLFARLRAEQVTFAKAQFAPNVAFVASMVYTDGSGHTILNAITGLIVGLIVDVPIYDPVRRGKLREALGLEQAAAAFQRQVEELITLEIEVTAIDCQRALAALIEAQRAANAAAENQDAVRQAYSRELVGAGDVVSGIAVDALAKIQVLQAQFTYLTLRSKLLRATADRETTYGY